jgi:hypothetical protein
LPSSYCFPLPGAKRTFVSKWVRPAGRTNKKPLLLAGVFFSGSPRGLPRGIIDTPSPLVGEGWDEGNNLVTLSPPPPSRGRGGGNPPPRRGESSS